MASLAHLSRLLVVEDEALILLDIEMTLRDMGVADVVTASAVDEALAVIDAGGLDAAVLDLHLGPTGWSYGVARRLQADGIPFIFSSGTVDVAEGFQTVPLVMKPFSGEQLAAALLQVTTGIEPRAAQ